MSCSIGNSANGLWKFGQSDVQSDQVVVEIALVELFHQFNQNNLTVADELRHIEAIAHVVGELGGVLDLFASCLGSLIAHSISRRDI